MFQPAAAEESLDEGRVDKPASPRRAFFGSVALGVVNFGRIGLQTVVLPIIARMLGPGAFGLVALAMPFILFANLLSDGGMGAALVRRPNAPREVESTVFWLSVAMGAAVAALIAAFAPLVAHLMRQPELAAVMLALTPILIISSSLSPANARISRSRNFGLFAVGDLLSVTLSSAAAILAAASGLGAWSLVIQQVVLWVAKVAWVMPASGFRPTFVCRPRLVKDLMAFGLNNVGANVADFMGKSAPALVIGAQLGVVAVGRYSMAYQLIRMPDLVLSGPLFLATFTAIAAMTASAVGPAQLSLRTLRLVLAALAPTFCGLALVADLVIGVFLGPKWHGAGTALAILSPAGFFLCLYSVIGAVLMGLGRSDLQFRLSAVCGLGMLAGAVVGGHFGLTLATAGVTLGAAAASPFYLATLARQLRVSWAELAGSASWPLAATAAMALAVMLARRELWAVPRLIELIGLVAIGAVVFAGVLILGGGRRLADDLRQTLPTANRPRPELAEGGSGL